MRVIILCAFLGACVIAPAACAAQGWLQLAKEVVPNFNTFCAKAGGQCVNKNKCEANTHVSRNFCTGNRVCCLPKSAVCEKVMKGFCTKDKAACANKEGYQMSFLKCSEEAHCCRPQVFSKPAQKLRGIKRCIACFKKTGAKGCKNCPQFLRRSFKRQMTNATDSDSFAIRPWHKKMWSKWTRGIAKDVPEEADTKKTGPNKTKFVKRVNRKKQRVLREDELEDEPEMEFTDELEDDGILFDGIEE